MSSSRIVFGYDAETLVDLAVTEIFRHGLMGNVGDVVALGQLGCQQLQGFLHGRAVPAEEFRSRWAEPT